MAVPDYDSQLVDALWVLLEASADVTALVRTGNRQKLSTPAGWLKDLFVARASADFPLIKIDLGDFSGGAFTQDQVFATEPAAGFNPGAANWPMPRETEIIIVLVTRELSLADQNTLEGAVEKTLLLAGPDLGDDKVNSWTYRAQRKITNRDEAKGTFRRKTTLRLRVRQEFEGKDFIA